MSLLWAQAATVEDERYDGDEDHDDHALHPTFEAAGIKHSPCGFSRCPNQDFEHSDAFDEAETRMFNGVRMPVKHLDLTKPVYGFEHTADMHTLRAYTRDPGARKGLPVVFQHQGRQHIMNGHHGIAAAMLRGDSSIPVHHINLDQEN